MPHRGRWWRSGARCPTRPPGRACGRRSGRALWRSGPFRTGWWWPLGQLLVALVPVPVLLLAVQRGVPTAVLVLAGCAALAAAVAVRQRRARRRRAAQARDQAHADHELQLVYQDWLQAEAARGIWALDRWRQTHSS